MIYSMTNILNKWFEWLKEKDDPVLIQPDYTPDEVGSQHSSFKNSGVIRELLIIGKVSQL